LTSYRVLVEPEGSPKSLVKEIAQEWGTSRAYVYKLAKQGCPTSTIEGATAWRSEHAKLGVGYRSGGSRSKVANNHQIGAGGESYDKTGASLRGALGLLVGRVKVKTIEQSLKVAIQIEQLAAQEVLDSLEPEKRLTAINAYNKAQANRMEAEKRVLEHQQTQKKLITVDEARAIIGRAWAPLLARIRSAPKRAALKANPSDDALAEEVFREEIEMAIVEGQSSYGAALV
jgi:hypothetical protein